MSDNAKPFITIIMITMYVWLTMLRRVAVFEALLVMLEIHEPIGSIQKSALKGSLHI